MALAIASAMDIGIDPVMAPAISVATLPALLLYMAVAKD